MMIIKEKSNNKTEKNTFLMNEYSIYLNTRLLVIFAYERLEINFFFIKKYHNLVYIVIN